MPYVPGKVPALQTEDGQALAAYLEDELQRIASSQNDDIQAIETRPAHAPPVRPRTGMLVYADGVDWDPGLGEGTYERFSGGWRKLFEGLGGGGGGPSNSNPIMDGVAAPGISVLYSRGDHVHPSDTSRVAKIGDTMTGTLNINPAANNHGLNYTGSASGVSAGHQYMNLLTTSADTRDTGGDTLATLGIIHNVTGGQTGFRYGFQSILNVTGASAAGAFYVGGIASLQPKANDTGTAISPKGDALAFNVSLFPNASATFWKTMVACSVDMSTTAGSSTTQRIGLQIMEEQSAVQGSVWDAGISLSGLGPCVGWKVGISFNNSIGAHAFAAGSTLIKTENAFTVTHGIDFTSYTFTGNAYASHGFNVTGAGAVSADTVNVTPTSGRRALTTTHAPSGSSTGHQYLNLISTATDTQDTGGDTLASLGILHNVGGGTVTGFRYGFQSILNVTAASAAGAAYIGGLANCQPKANDTGTGVTPKGDAMAFNVSMFPSAAATFWNTMVSCSIDMSTTAGSSMKQRIGLQIMEEGSAVQGSTWDIALSISGALNPVGWKNGILFGDQLGNHPFSASATLIATTGAFTVAKGIDFTSYTFTGNAFASHGFSVSNIGGVLATGSYVLNDGATGNIFINANITTSYNFNLPIAAATAVGQPLISGTATSFGSAAMTWGPITGTGNFVKSASPTLTGVTTADSILLVEPTNGTMIQLQNSSVGATNPNKYIRMGAAGTLEIVNNAYTVVISSLSDAGALTLAGGITTPASSVNTLGDVYAVRDATHGAVFFGTAQYIYYDGAQFVHQGGPIYDTAGIVGTATNDNAAAGIVGEYKEAVSDGGGHTFTVTIASPAVITEAGHNYTNSGVAIFVPTTTGALPTGLTAGTTYWVIPSSVSGSTFQVATSIANAIAGTAVNTSGTQSGVHTGTAARALTSLTVVDLGAISLTAGDWLVFGNCVLVAANTATTTFLDAAISTTLTTLPPLTLQTNQFQVTFPTNGPANCLILPIRRLKLAATTTVYLEGMVQFGVAGYTGSGTIQATRVR